MAKTTKSPAKKPTKKPAKKPPAKKVAKKVARAATVGRSAILPLDSVASAAVLDRLWSVIESRRSADPAISHSARLMARGTAKVAQKFGEEAVECLIEAVAGNHAALVAESADVLYHLLVLWVNAGIVPGEVWAELVRREGVSGVAEKASRGTVLKVETSKIP